MKSQTNKISFKKHTIIELNDAQLKTVLGGTTTGPNVPEVPGSLPPTSTANCKTNHTTSINPTLFN